MDENKKTTRTFLIEPVITFGVILAIGLILSTIIAATVFYKSRPATNTLSVTGSAKISVTSDSVTWVGQFTDNITAGSLKEGYAQMADDSVLVEKFLADQGFTKDQYILSPVFMDENYDSNNGYQDPANKRYTLRQTIDLTSTDVKKVTAISKNTEDLISSGVIFSTQRLEYSYSKLPELRVSLLSDALKDAKARAGKIAENSGKQVGDLQSASSGVVQVLAAGSNNIDDYGSYDTSTIDKDVMVTVKATFSLK